MEDQSVKIQRCSNLIKGFMVLVIFMQALQIYQTNVMDLGALAGAFGVLSLLRGLLLSPSLLAAPIKYWFKANYTFPQESYKYLLLAFILIIVSAF
jgi:hypothetical protein